MGQVGLAPGGHRTTTNRKTILPPSTIPIIPTITRIAGRTGAIGEIVWGHGLVNMATKGTATITILTTTTAAAAEEAAMIGTELEIETEIETGTEIETETVTTPTALTPDTIPIPTALHLTACLLPHHLTLHTRPPKNLRQPLLMNHPLLLVKGDLDLGRGALCLE